MKRLALACAATLALATTAIMLTSPVDAQSGYFGGRPDDGWGNARGLPGGSWRESCRYPGMRGNVLVAQCRTSYDRWVDARIDPNICRGGRLANDDGRLVCEIAGGGWGAGGGWEIPGGTWRESCRYPVMRGRFLSAECRTSRGSWTNVTVDIRACRSGRLANIEGNLACEGGGYGPGGGYRPGNAAFPGGSWRESCRGASMRGDTLSAQCRDRSDYWSNSAINMRSCGSGRVANRNGQLVCD